MDTFYGIEINLISSIIFAAIGFGLAKLFTWLKWRKRLKALEQTARENEIAICVRVGGNSKPVDDVKEYIKINLNLLELFKIINGIPVIFIT